MGNRRSSQTLTVDDCESQRDRKGGPKPAQKLSKEQRDALVQQKHSRSSMAMTRKQVGETK